MLFEFFIAITLPIIFVLTVGAATVFIITLGQLIECKETLNAKGKALFYAIIVYFIVLAMVMWNVLCYCD